MMITGAIVFPHKAANDLPFPCLYAPASVIKALAFVVSSVSTMFQRNPLCDKSTGVEERRNTNELVHAMAHAA